MFGLNKDKRRKKSSAIVVGGSLAGLMTAISLAEKGVQVFLFEKTKEGSRTGAGLQVDGSNFSQSTTEKG